MNINRSGGSTLTLFASLLMALGTAQAAEVDLLVQLRRSAPASLTGNRSIATKDLASQVPALAGWLQENDVQLVQSISDTTTRGKSLTGSGSIVRIVLESDTAPTDLMRDLRARGDVTHVEPNQRGRLATTPTDPFYVEQAGDLAPIGIESAWDIQPGSNASVRVAIIDSGIETTHEDLSGTYDPIASSDVANGRAMLVDEVGHGTRIAGIVGAHGNNGTGIAGVGYGSTLLVYDVYNDDGYILLSDVITAVDRARNDGARVVNLSLAFNAPSRLLEESCRRAEDAGILLVAAAGNDNQGDVPAYPASFPSVMGIGAVNDAGTGRAVFSNFNGIQRDLVDLYAPGSTLFSTVPGSQYNGTFTTGTSFSAPVVCGVAALLMAKYPEQSGAAVRAHLLATASPIAGFQPTGGAGAGLVNAAAALSTPMLPNIRIDRIVVDDRKALDPDNDGDGVLDRGESAELVIFLSNDAADAFDITATVSTSSGAISSLGDAEATFGELRSGKATSNGGDRIGIVEVDDSATAQEVAFTLELESDGQSIGALAFSLPLEDEVDARGVVTSPRTYTADKTYQVSENLLWRSAITIEPGTKFKVSPGVTIRVENGATVSAEGTEASPIIFTSAVTAPEPGTTPLLGELGPRTEAINLSGVENVFYVSATTGNDTTGNGTMGNPWRTFEGAREGVPSGLASFALAIAEGSYTATEQNPLVLYTQTQLYGGYSADFSQRDIFTHPSILHGSGEIPALRIAPGGSGNKIDGFTLSNVGGSAIAGGSSTSTGNTLSNCTVAIENIRSNDSNDAMVARGECQVRNCLFMPSAPLVYTCGSIWAGAQTNYTIERSLFLKTLPFGRETGIYAGGESIIRNNGFLGLSGYAMNVSPGENDLSTVENNMLINNFYGMNIGTEPDEKPTDIYNNLVIGGDSGISGGSNSKIINNIIWNHSGFNLRVLGGTVIRNNIVEDGEALTDPATGTLELDPELIIGVQFGTVTDAEYSPTTLLSRLVLDAASPFPTPPVGTVLEIEDVYFYVAISEGSELTVVGDATGQGTISYPNDYKIESYRLSANSPARGAGIGPAVDAQVPTDDIDGETRSGATTDIGPDLYSTEGSLANFAWNTLLIQDSATSATFRHVTFENGTGVQVNSPDVLFDNCSYLNNADFGLRASVPLGAPIINASAEYNRGPGLDVPGSTVTGGTARANFESGIVAETVTHATAEANGIDGVVADSASTSTARLNLGAGFRTQLLADKLVSESNAVGIVSSAGAVTNSRAIGNIGVGIEALDGGTVVGSFSYGNASHGMTVEAVDVSGTTSRSNGGYGVFSTGGASLIDCLITDNLIGSVSGIANVTGSTLSGNGAAVSDISTLTGSFIGFGAGDGPHAVHATNSTLVGNSGTGARISGTLTNSWVARNGGIGVDGIDGQAVVSNSTIRENGGGGTLNVFSVSDSNYLSNGPIEAEDNVLGGSLADRSLEDNWWGTSNNLKFQNTQPFDDLDFLLDTLDGSGDYLLDVWNPASEPVANAPNGDAPAFALSVTPNLDEPVNIGPTFFTIEFSSPMDTGVNPSVTFDREAPYTFRVVEPGPGWINNRTYRGIFWVQGDTGDGLNRVRIDNARDANGFLLPSDSSHPFTIDTDVDTPANNGLATATGSRTMRLTWDPDPSARPGKTVKGTLDRVGYNIQRTTYLDKVGDDAALEAGLVRINTRIVYDTVYNDTGLEPGTLYYYRVYDVRPGEVLETEPVNANEWTVFVGLTQPAGDEKVDYWMFR